MIARGHAFRFDDHPPWLSPRGRGIGEFVIPATAEGRLLTLGMREGDSLLEEAARLLHDRGGLAQ